MRLHRLAVTAFGPFAETVEVDFDEVSLAGLFLIQGPTGAGKTSLLDAICFALYAGVPGTRPGGRALRSDHAARDVIPRVVLDFTTGTRRFRVARSPEFLRPKRRGPGETKSPATVVLEEHHLGRWVVRSTRADEVGEIVTEVLGMGLEQFSKVVLLPQGEFAAFLRSTAEERRLLLERLFDISTWTGVEEWLVERRRLLAADAAEASAGLDTDLARLGDVVATLPPAVVGDLAPWAVIPLDALAGVVSDLRARGDAHAGDALAVLAAADLTVNRAEAARVEAQDLAGRQRRGCAARAALVDLDGRAGAHAEDVDRAERAQRAASLGGDLRALERARARVSAVAQELEVSRGPVVALAAGDWSLGAAVGWQQSLAEGDAALTDGRRSAAEVRGLIRDRDARERVLHEAEEELSRRCVLVELRASAVLEARRAVERARSAGTTAAALSQRVRAVEEVHRILVHEASGRVRAVALAEQLRRTRDTEQESRETYLSLRQTRLDGMAAELASTLTDGVPCGVCGSLAHPSPATAAASVSAHEVAAAEEAWLVLRRRVEQLGAAVEVQRELVRTRTADAARAWAALVVDGAGDVGAGAAGSGEAGAGAAGSGDAGAGAAGAGAAGSGDEGAESEGSASGVESGSGAGPTRAAGSAWVVAADAGVPEIDTVTTLLVSLRAEQQGVATLAEGFTRAVRVLDATEEQHRAAVAKVAEGVELLARHQAALAERDDQLARRLREVAATVAAHASCPCGPKAKAETDVGTAGAGVGLVPADAEDSGTDWSVLTHLDAVHREHVRVTESVGRLVEGLAAAGRAAADLAEVEASLAISLGEHGFHSVEEALSARLTSEVLLALREAIRVHADRLATARATLADEGVAAALERSVVDESTAVAAGVVARQAQRVAQQVQTRAEQSSHRLDALTDSVVTRCRTLGPLRTAAAQAAGLADTVTGIGPENALRMRLSSFVLAARLEKVALLANERLAVMGDGRYQLQHTDDLASGGRRSGLGLVVRDLWTGQVRDTASLSGGESFMASLALALGLADAVREEAGGFDLQTLFIDEGFGTLDDESLEQVLAVLDGLRDGGRAVGVVSHVSDLLTRIPAQICVTKRATGSSVQVLGTTGAVA
ncbi:MAG: AAA family ATPase [Lapillicoccus sp.]